MPFLEELYGKENIKIILLEITPEEQFSEILTEKFAN